MKKFLSILFLINFQAYSASDRDSSHLFICSDGRVAMSEADKDFAIFERLGLGKPYNIDTPKQTVLDVFKLVRSHTVDIPHVSIETLMLALIFGVKNQLLKSHINVCLDDAGIDEQRLKSFAKKLKITECSTSTSSAPV